MKLKSQSVVLPKFVLLAVCSTQFLIACTNREVPVTIHEGPVVGDEVVVAPTGPAVDVSGLFKLNPEALNAKIDASNRKGGSPIALSEKISTLNALEPFILNRSVLDDPRAINTKAMRAALTAFSATLTDLAASNPEQAAPWIEKTRVMIESGCDGEMKGCTNLKFFRGDSNSAKIMELSANALDKEIDSEKTGSKRRDELVRVYYRRLAVAFDLRNQIGDSQFEFMYLARAAEYAEAFGRSEDKSRERELLTRHSEVFEMILNRFNPDLTDPNFKARFEGFVNAFSPWNYSRRVENPFGQAATRMLSLAAKSFLYDGKSGQLSTSLVESIKRSQQIAPSTSKDGVKEDPLDSLEDSFATISNALQNQEPGIWKNLLLSDAVKRDEYFFMIDRIYGDHLTPDDASEIWRGSRRDSTALLKAAEQYIKIQIAGQIVRTNRYMSDIYSNKEWSSATLFQKAVEKSYPISTQWNQMLSRIDRIQLFLDRNLKASDDAYSTEEFKHVNQMLTSVRRNIKYLSVYPNMMLMAYFMAEVKFKLDIMTFFGKLEIDSATIISWFFDGRMGPLFNFGNDGEALKRIETLYAFLFALKTETFKAFSVSETKKLDVPRFFEVVIGKFLDADRLELEQSLETVRKDMRQSSSMATFLQVCRQDREILAQGGKPGTKGATLAIDFGQMSNAVYVGSSTGYGGDAWRFHNGRLIEQVKTVNEGLRRKLDFVGIMIGLLEKHLEKSGIAEASRLETRVKIDAYLNNVRGLQTEYLTEVTRWNKTLSSCLDQAVQLEIDRQNDLTELEIRHLRQVWKLMKAARSSNDAAALNQATQYLTSTLGINDLNSAANYKPISQITADEYVYAEFDVLLRMRQNLKTVAPNVRILMPSDLTDTSYWRERKQVAISFNENEQVFVTEALRNFNDSYSAYVKWLNTTADPEIFANRLKLNVELYKLDTVQIFDTNAAACQGKTNITECPKTTFRLTARDLVNETATVVSLLSLTENGGQQKKDTKYLQLLGSTGRWTKDKLKGFMLDANTDPISLYETVYKVLSEDETALNEARDYNTTKRSVGHFLFAPEAEFEDIIGRGFAPLVNNHFGRIKALEVAIHEKEKADAASKKTLEYSYEIREGRIISTPIETESGVPVYLSRQKIDDMNTRRVLFDRETGNAFAAKSNPSAAGRN